MKNKVVEKEVGGSFLIEAVGIRQNCIYSVNYKNITILGSRQVLMKGFRNNFFTP